MIVYPTISRKLSYGIPVRAFDKIDGSCVRAEWNGKFTKFGTRNRLLDPREPMLGEAILLIKDKYAEPLTRIFKKERLQRATAFFEFYGPNSFAGNHEDEPHDVVLFDVHVPKKGFIPSSRFVKLFRRVDIPIVVYVGNLNKELVNQVRGGALPGVTFEGVVCKGTHRGKVVMYKIKSDAWVEKLHGFCKGNTKLFEELL